MSIKNEPKRVIFQGNATPFGARITSIDDKPFHDIVPGPPSSSLSSEGGWNRSEGKGSSYLDIFHWGSTLAECKGELRADGHAVSTVTSSIENFVVINKPHKFEAGRLRVCVVSTLAPNGATSVVATQMAFDDLRINGKKIDVIYDGAKLDGYFKAKAPNQPGQPPVRSFVTVRKQGEEPAEFLAVEGLGKLYFGEVLMAGNTRTVTMVRMVLGCQVGGSAAAAQSDPGVNWGT